VALAIPSHHESNKVTKQGFVLPRILRRKSSESIPLFFHGPFIYFFVPPKESVLARGGIVTLVSNRFFEYRKKRCPESALWIFLEACTFA